MPAPRRQSIPVVFLIRTAYQSLWQHRDDALRLGFIPTLICFAGFLYGGDSMEAAGALYQIGSTEPPPPGVTFGVFATLAIVLVGTVLIVSNWLRFMLLGPMGAVGLGLSIGRAHILFLVWAVVLGFAGAIAFSVASMPLLLMPGALGWLGMGVLIIAILVVAARLLPFLIGQAIAQPMSLQQAWNASRGNGIALASALVLVEIPMWLAATILGQLLLAVGFAAVAPKAMLFIWAVFQVATSILQAGVLAIAFRQIVGIRV